MKYFLLITLITLNILSYSYSDIGVCNGDGSCFTIPKESEETLVKKLCDGENSITLNGIRYCEADDLERCPSLPSNVSCYIEMPSPSQSNGTNNFTSTLKEVNSGFLQALGAMFLAGLVGLYPPIRKRISNLLGRNKQPLLETTVESDKENEEQIYP